MENNNEKKTTKARIIEAATTEFAQYGYHATTTRMIATRADVDVSTLHYHCGDKAELFVATVEATNDKIHEKHKEVEKLVRGKTLEYRLSIAVDVIADYYFEHPEYAKLSYHVCFSNLRDETQNLERAQASSISLITDIAHFAFGVETEEANKPNTEILCIMGLSELIRLYVTGESCFNLNLGFETTEYKKAVKQIVCRLFSLFAITKF